MANRPMKRGSSVSPNEDTLTSAAADNPTATVSPAPAAAASSAPDAAGHNAAKISPGLIPGAEVIGRGIYLRPRQPYELKAFLFEHRQNQTQLYTSLETGQTYVVPEDCGVNESPPLPVDQRLGETVIEESWDRFSKKLSLNVTTAVNSKIFSIDASGFQAASLRSEENSYYALRSSFIPFWNLYMPSVPNLRQNALEAEVPDGPFNASHRERYAQVFDRYGTHYVKSAWVGGKASLAFIVAKSSQLTKEEINAGVQTALSGIISGNVSDDQQKSEDKFRSNSSCRVFGSGGDQICLAGISTLDQEAYKKWINSIKGNPKVIQLGVTGIWTLVKDPAKANALKEAYIYETSFTPLTAILPIGTSFYFAKGDEIFEYKPERRREGGRRMIGKFDTTTNLFKQLQNESFSRFSRPHSAFSLYGFGENLEHKVYLFRWQQCLRIDVSKSPPIVDEGYPKNIQDDWPGVDFDRIDATLAVAPNRVYFFRGSRYVRVDVPKEGRPTLGTRDLIARRWTGVTFDKLDTAVYWGNSKVYFFHEDQYIRYDMGTYKADPGYPKFILSNYVEDWEFFGTE